MSKYLIYTDVHFSEFSSIIRTQGENYSTRLENLIKSINWAEEQAVINNCDEIFILGDFFDKPDLNSIELTALQEIKWASCKHTFLVGNHEASNKSLRYNSVNALQSKNFEIINEPVLINNSEFNLILIPYITESERLSLEEYINNFTLFDKSKDTYIFSHNDLKGINYGIIESKEGFTLDEITKNCRLYLNGHIHSQSQFCTNGFNIGNLTGQNFTEDAFQYEHSVAIFDTIGDLNFIENPFAFNFYKIIINSEDDLSIFSKLKNNAIVSIKCIESLKEKVEAELEKYPNIVQKRLLIEKVISNDFTEEDLTGSITMDYIDRFIECCKQHINNNDILDFELDMIRKNNSII